MTLNKIPYSVLIDQPYEQEILNDYEVTNNETLVNFLTSMHGQCKQFCHLHDCIEHQYVPFVVGKGDSQHLEIILYASNGPVVETIAMPQLGTVDFLTYVLSSISFWLGFSPLGILVFMKSRNDKMVKLRRNKKISPIKVNY